MICLIPWYSSFQNWSKNDFLEFFSVKYLFKKKLRIKNGAAKFLVQIFEKRYFTLRNAQNSIFDQF